MRSIVRNAVMDALAPLLSRMGVDKAGLPYISVEVPEGKFGDFSTNAAMVCAKPLKNAPRKIAEELVAGMKDNPLFSAIDIAGPGFINFTVKPEYWREDFRKIPADNSDYGTLPGIPGEKVLIEFVSANPTGPLHIGHGRGAAVGDSLARLLAKAGYDVTAEYYTNDTGLQMENLGRSTLARYRQLLGQEAALPENCYQGEYIKDIAREIAERDGKVYLEKPEAETLPFFTTYTADKILDDIKDDLARFRISFHVWASEKSFHESGAVEQTIQKLRQQGAIYEQDGALWLKTMDLAGDEKDRVVKRANGVTTYLAADIAYHADKYRRGFTRIIDIWGADHHGYVARMKAAAKALGQNPDSLQPILIQIVSLKKEGQIVAMSTRSGKFTTLREVVNDVGVDAARFTFLTRSHDAQLEFDLDLTKQQSSENPVYYVQYAHARISNIFKTARERGIEPFPENPAWNRLTQDDELNLMKKALFFPALVEDAAKGLSPHQTTHYLVELAGMFHKYYNVNRVVTADVELTLARLALAARLRTVIKNGLDLLGVGAPEKM